MLTFIDISSHQEGLDLNKVLPALGGVIIKATEGTGYVNPHCDPWVQTAIKMNKPWGFYHFAGDSDAVREANYFYSNCKNYFGHGIPVLDWETGQTVSWVNQFVRHIHELTGVWPWIYANPWRINQGGVESNCGRWVAQYPGFATFDAAKKNKPQSTQGLVCAWQFTNKGVVNGWGSLVDCSLFYGDDAAWNKYAGKKSTPVDNPVENSKSVLENSEYKVTIERK